MLLHFLNVLITRVSDLNQTLMLSISFENDFINHLQLVEFPLSVISNSVWSFKLFLLPICSYGRSCINKMKDNVLCM